MAVRHGNFVSAVLWSFLQISSERLVQAAVFLVTARLLGPGEFGVAALAIAPAAIATHVMRGVVIAVVQRPHETEGFLSACFWFALAISVAMSFVMIVFAPAAGAILHLPQIVPLMSVCAIAPVVSALCV